MLILPWLCAETVKNVSNIPREGQIFIQLSTIMSKEIRNKFEGESCVNEYRGRDFGGWRLVPKVTN